MDKILNRGIKEIINQYPEVGDILDNYDIGCVPCSVGTCLLKDIVEIHNLQPQDEQKLMLQIARVIYPDRDITIPVRQRKTQSGPEGLKYSPPLQKLVNEHKLIKRWVALIPEVIEDMDLNTEAGRQRLTAGIDFLRSFADKYHHAKEEEILFKYFDEDLDILKVMHEDHESARSHVRAICDAVERKDENSAAEHLNAYRELLPEHIKREDEILYPWMDRQLSDRQIGKLFSEFNDIDEQFGEAPQQHENFIEKMESRFGIEPLQA